MRFRSLEVTVGGHLWRAVSAGKNNMIDDGTLEINDHIKQYATTIADWSYRELVEWLYTWADRFNMHFGLNITTPVIQIERLRRRAMGAYRNSGNGFGLAHEITFNEKYFDGSVVELLDTCLHELLHEWQALHGRPPSARSGNYHNREFRERAKALGLLVDERGRSGGIEPGPFMALLEAHGISIHHAGPGALPKPTKPTGTKMMKWSCKCTNVRAAVELRAECLRCGAIFTRAAASW
jgi:hypothetical protein